MPTRNVLKGTQLYTILFIGVIFTAVAMVALAYWGVREIRRDAAVVAVESSARGLSGAMTVLVNAVTSANEEIGTDKLSSLRSDRLRETLRQTLGRYSVLVAIMVSDGEGLRYSLTRRDDGLVECVPQRDAEDSIEWKLVAPDGSVSGTTPRERFDQDAVDTGFSEIYHSLKPGEVSWRSVYGAFDSGESWLSASVLVEVDGLPYMLSYVFPVEAVVRQLGGAEKGSAEKIFLYWPSGKVFPVSDLSSLEVRHDKPLEVVTATDVKDPVIAGAAGRLNSMGDDVSEPFSYRVGDETWWAYVTPLSVFGNTMSLGVAVPRKNIVSTLTSDTFLQAFIAVLLVLAGAALFVLHRNRARIESMGLRQKAARTGEDVLRLIAEGESASLEFKQTLRYNLKAEKNGKEIEHASMKTVAAFMNSEGGTLLVGVADNGAVTGFKEDELGNDDRALLHFNNLVNQHIGTEFARYVDTAIIEVQGEHVLRAYCMPASAPAILKNGKVEEFFVRSGPASRQLSLSQFYEWLQNH